MDENDSKYSCNLTISGDSISKGIIFDEVKRKYVILEGNYVTLLKGKFNGIIRNTAKFGNTLIKGVHKLKDDIVNNKPDVVLLEYGGNDCDFNWIEVCSNPNSVHKPKTDFDIFVSKLKETLHFLKKNNITSVVMTLPPLNADRYLKWISKSDISAEANILKWLGNVSKIYWWHEKYSSAVLKIAEDTNTKCIDIRASFLQYPDFTKFLCLDGIHPNKFGHEIIANKIIDFILSNKPYLIKDNTNSNYTRNLLF